jgi:predicted AlkP superfamily pyrophosphatase or phosphodiesterase
VIKVINIDYTKLDIVDLTRCISNKFGTSFANTDKIKKLSKILNLKKKVVLVLIDGLGYYKVQSLNDDSILKKNCITSLQTVNPSSTACVLTSLYTGEYPQKHGILGWWSYSKSNNLSYYSLLLKNRLTDKTIEKENININTLINSTSIFDKYNKKISVIMNKYIYNSTYSTYMSGKNSTNIGFEDTKDAFNKALKSSKDFDFTHLYLDVIDTKSHCHGVNSKEVSNEIKKIEKGLEFLCDNKDDDVSIVVISDHGQVDMSELIYLNKNHDYNEFFYALPSADTRTLVFFVKEEKKTLFKNKFIKDFGDDFILLSNDEIKDLHILGNETNNELITDSLGEYMAIAKSNKFLVCDEISKNDYKDVIGNHTGFTKEELTIPLILI